MGSRKTGLQERSRRDAAQVLEIHLVSSDEFNIVIEKLILSLSVLLCHLVCVQLRISEGLICSQVEYQLV